MPSRSPDCGGSVPNMHTAQGWGGRRLPHPPRAPFCASRLYVPASPLAFPSLWNVNICFLHGDSLRRTEFSQVRKKEHVRPFILPGNKRNCRGLVKTHPLPASPGPTQLRHSDSGCQSHFPSSPERWQKDYFLMIWTLHTHIKTCVGDDMVWRERERGGGRLSATLYLLRGSVINTP